MPKPTVNAVRNGAMSLRSHFILLTLATLLPLAVFAVIVAIVLVQREQETLRRGAEQRTLALLTAVDGELRSSITTLEALAVVPSLAETNLAYFRRTATAVLKSQPDWLNINLSLPDGQQVVNLQVPEGKPLPNIRKLDRTFDELLATGRPAIGDLAYGPVTKRWNFAVRAPVIRDGRIKYVLSAVVNPESINRIIAAQRLESGWGAVVLDRNQRFVARNWNPGKYLGEFASQSLRDALAESPSGWFRGRTVEGVEVYSPYHRSAVTGWTVSMGVPVWTLEAGATRAAALLALGLLFALLGAIALARLVGRRIADPISSLAQAAGAMGRGERVDIPQSARVAELRTLEAGLRIATQAVRERERQVEGEAQSLRAADRAKDEFLAVLSHELRNPLAALTAAAHVLKVADPRADAAAKARGVIDRQTKHMSHLIADLLDISRVALGKLGLERERFDLAEVVAKLVKVWRASGRFERHEITLQTKTVWVDADRARMEQVAANLLDNALKFTPAGRRITVGVRPEGDAAVLQVADEGAGLAAGTTESVFELFVQGDGRPAEAHTGMGIGLALVKRLSEMHGGSVAAASEGPGRGAVFTVRLPAVPAPQPQPSRTDALAAARSILVVEDNDDAREMLEAALALHGHAVRAAGNGAAGLALAEEAPPDVALIDISLPDIDGYEVARRLRAGTAGRRMGLIAVTGHGRPEDQRRAFDAGFDAHLTKPVSAERLRQAIARLP
jgi:signal transduction histidine kinase/CheY-like chemotaxis protein